MNLKDMLIRHKELLKNNWCGNDGLERNDFESKEEWYNRIFGKHNRKKIWNQKFWKYRITQSKIRIKTQE